MNSALSMLMCGCVVDSDSIHGEFHDDCYIVECPFCKATFSFDDLAIWSMGNKESIRMHMFNAISITNPLITYHNEIFEIVNICGDCGYPVVRKPTKLDKKYHLNVPETDTIQLFN